MIYVDTREPKAYYEYLKHCGFDVERVTLDTGDYVCGPVVVERKSMQDFIHSIVDQRIHLQAQRLSEHPVPILLITGKYSDIPHFGQSLGVTPDQITGEIASLVVRYGLRSVIWTYDDLEGVIIAAKICKKVAEGKLDIPRIVRKAKHDDMRVSALVNLLRINRRLAQNLLRKFKTVRRVIEATDDELMTVEGIGVITVRKIRSILDEVFAD